MAGGISFAIEVDDNKVRLMLDQLPKVIEQKLKETIGELTNELLPMVLAGEPVRTGRMRRLTQAFVDEGFSKKTGGHWIRGRVKVLRTVDANVAAAAGALEYGAPGTRRHGPVEVRGYRRRSGVVRKYERRRPKIRAMFFMRGPMRMMRPRIEARLQAIVNDALQARNFR